MPKWRKALFPEAGKARTGTEGMLPQRGIDPEMQLTPRFPAPDFQNILVSGGNLLYNIGRKRNQMNTGEVPP